MKYGNSRIRRFRVSWTRRVLIGAIAAVVSVAMAACGLQKGTHLGCSNGRVHRPKGAVKACGPATIRVRLDVHSAGVAAGTAILPLDFTNVSRATCRLAGFPVVTLATGRAGRQIGAAAAADRSLLAKTLELTAGRTAHIWLRMLDVLNLPASECQPVSAAGLRVALPGQAIGTFISHPVITCARPLHGTDILMAEPFRLGHAMPGTAQ